MFMIGLPEGEQYWSVALENPLQPEMVLTSLKVEPGAVTTSTVTKRVWKQGEKLRHHLINPRTNEPAESDWLSVTVLAPHACEAEVYAKVLIIGGSQESQEIVLNCSPRLFYLAVDGEAKIWGTQKSLELIHVH